MLGPLIIHNLKEMEQAFKDAEKSGHALILKNAEDSIFYLGPAYLFEMFTFVSNKFPTVKAEFICDVADLAAYAQIALKLGFKQIFFSGSEEVLKKLQQIAAHYNAKVISSI